MKPYSFHIDEHTVRKLLQWLPRKAPSEVRKEVRLHAVVMFLFGVFFLINHAHLGLEWAAALMGLGVAGMIWAERRVYLFNGLFMFLYGLAQVVPVTLSPMNAPTFAGADYLPAIAATVFLCWGVQQFSMLGLNAQVRVARTAATSVQTAGTSPLVRRIGRFALIASGFLWAYALGLIAMRWSELMPYGDATLLEMVGRYPDIAVFLAMALFALGGGCVLTCRRKLMYPDAKVVAQVLIVGLVFVIWGLLATFNPADPKSLFNPMLAAGGVVLVKPYVWLSLLPAVMGFNRWYGKALDRELEERLS